MKQNFGFSEYQPENSSNNERTEQELLDSELDKDVHLKDKNSSKNAFDTARAFFAKYGLLKKAAVGTAAVESILGAYTGMNENIEAAIPQVTEIMPKVSVIEVADSTFQKPLKVTLEKMKYTVEDKSKSLNDYSEFVTVAKFIDELGSEEDEALQSFEDIKEKSDEEAEASVDLNNQITVGGEGGKNIDPVTTAIDCKVREIEKQTLPDSIVDTFKDGNYKTVEAIEDLLLYRVYGGNSEKQGCFLTTEKPVDRLYSKMESALLQEWKNTREYYCEVYISKGTKMNIGKVGEQKTLDNASLPGGADQIIVSREFAGDKSNFGESVELSFSSEYLQFSRRADLMYPLNLPASTQN